MSKKQSKSQRIGSIIDKMGNHKGLVQFLYFRLMIAMAEDKVPSCGGISMGGLLATTNEYVLTGDIKESIPVKQDWIDFFDSQIPAYIKWKGL